MYRASESDILHGVEFAGLYVSVFTMATGIIGMLAIRKHASLRMRMCCFAIDIIMTIFLAVQTFAMCCASGAMLAFHTISWDTVRLLPQEEYRVLLPQEKYRVLLFIC